MKQIAFFIAAILATWGNINAQTIAEYDSLVVNFFYSQQLDSALVYAGKALTLVEEQTGKEDTLYANKLHDLAYIYFFLGKFEKAIQYEAECKDIRARILGKENVLYITCCTNLSLFHQKSGDYTRAEMLLSEAAEIIENIYGEEHTLYAGMCNKLASLYFKTGKNSKAKQLFLKSKRIREQLLGKDHPEYINSCNNLGVFYTSTGNYAEAESFFLEVKAYREKQGKETNNYALICNNLGQLYSNTGNYSKAEALFKESKKIREKIRGKEHPDYAFTCNNMAAMYISMGDFKQAELYHSEANKIFKKVFGSEHHSYATSCNNLAEVYRFTSKYAEAEALFLEAKQIQEQILGTDHRDYALSCNNLAQLYRDMSRYEKAILLQTEAKKTYKKALGKDHIRYVISCNNLAGLYTILGDHSKAEQLFREANDILNALSDRSLKFMSENEREKYLNTKINMYFNMFHTFYLTKQREKKELSALVYNNALKNKAQLLRSAAAMRKVVLQSNDKTLINKYEEMNSIGQMLNKEYTKALNERRSDIKDLEEKMNKLEKDLVKQTNELSSFELLTGAGINWKNVRNSLKKDETAVEFIHFLLSDFKKGKFTDSTLYFALVLRKDYKFPKAVFLFEENQLKELLNHTESESEYSYIKQLYDPKSERADSLYTLVWKPLKKYLKRSKNIYISPSGILNRISFDALPYNKKRLISDKYKIIYTSTTAETVNKTGLYDKDINNVVLFGGIDYSVQPDEMKQFAYMINDPTGNEATEPPVLFADLEIEYDVNKFRNLQVIDSLSRNISWDYLPGSLREAENIENMLNAKNVSINFYKNKNANEEQFKILEKNSPSVLHISTHGFYFGDDDRSENYKLIIDEDVSFVHSENPLLRSGLILAGGNNAFQDKSLPIGVEDGVVTASEISKLNFLKTKLVVLSACQTGLGDVKGSEGVYGLQRAFKMAGADYLIYSLWEVPDKTTEELMTSFYEYWFSGLEIRSAFKKAQEHLKAKYSDIPGSAFAWAAFVLLK